MDESVTVQPMPLRQQLREVFGLTWRVVKVNPLRVYGLLYYRIAGRHDEDMRQRVEEWVKAAEKGHSHAS